MPYATLLERGLLVLNGDDTLPFLQGLVSNDVLKLRDVGIAYAAMLTPQGKFLHDFFAVASGASVLIDGEKSRLQELQKRLLMYRLRSKVTIDVMPDSIGIVAVWNEAQCPKPADGLLAFADPRLPALGWRVYGDIKQAEQWCLSHALLPATLEDYDLHRITLGVPEGGHDLIADKSFLLPFGFEDLHGVDFNKGCYVGQEVTARSKHLAQARKFIYKVQGHGNALPAAGTPVYYGETQAGELRSARGLAGLALMSVEAVEKERISGDGFTCNQQPVGIILPEWVKNAPGTKA